MVAEKAWLLPATSLTLRVAAFVEVPPDPPEPEPPEAFD